MVAPSIPESSGLSWRRAPLYIDCHELCRWVLERRSGGSPDSLLERICTESLDLLGAVANALSFPARRSQTLETADEIVARLRVFVRIASELGVIRPTGCRFLTASLDRIGRMIGGWSRSMTPKS